MVDPKLLTDIYTKAALCRAFEKSVYEKVKENTIKIPVYLSAGQEYAAATLATFYASLLPNERQIFIQHRGHSTYLSFGGKIEALMDELLGKKTGCANGLGGSASLHSIEANIFGHDGLMGSHGPISVGMCYANKVPTICFIGDAAAEEDYFLAALGWASTKKLPIIFIVEDNNLSILTEKKVRRNWSMSEVAKGFEIEAYNISDDPTEIVSKLKNTIQEPLLLNINTTRLFWHSGAGVDDGDYNDRHLSIRKILNDTVVSQIDKNAEELIQEKWQICLNN